MPENYLMRYHNEESGFTSFVMPLAEVTCYVLVFNAEGALTRPYIPCRTFERACALAQELILP